MSVRKRILKLAREYKIEGTGNINQHKSDLIKLMRHFPFMYDPRDPSHNFRSRRDLLWSTFAEVFKCHETQVRKKWQLLRNNFRRQKMARKRQKRASAAGSRPLLEQMSNGSGAKSWKICRKNCVAKRRCPLNHDNMEEYYFMLPDSHLQYLDLEMETPSNTGKELFVTDLAAEHNLFPDVADVQDFLFVKLIAHGLRRITCPIQRLRVQEEILKIIVRYSIKENAQNES